MLQRKLCTLALLLPLLAALAVAAAQPQKRPPRKPAATPEDALRQHMEAIRTGDAEAFLAVLPAGYSNRVRNWLAAGEEAAEAINILAEITEDKFGPDPQTWIRKIDYSRSKVVAGLISYEIRAYEVVGGKTVPEGGRAAFKVKLTIWPWEQRDHTLVEKTLEADIVTTREQDGWKVIPVQEEKAESPAQKPSQPPMPQDADVVVAPAPLSKANLDQGVKYMARLKGVSEQAAKDIKAGKYKSHDEVHRALDKELPPSSKPIGQLPFDFVREPRSARSAPK